MSLKVNMALNSSSLPATKLGEVRPKSRPRFGTGLAAIFGGKGLPKDSLNLLLFVSGLFGFIWGAGFFSCWQVAVEGAQVIAGIVKYPVNNPFYIYELKAWTLLHQIPALGLRLGLSERFLSILLSGVMGMLSFQALALSVYIFSRNVKISLFCALLIYVTGSVSFHANYPIFLVGTSATYGSIGLSFVFVAIAMIAAGHVRLGALMLGLSPAVHGALGMLGTLTFFAAALLEKKNIEFFKKKFVPFYLLGIALTLLSFGLQWPLIRNIPPIDPSIAKHHFTAFIRAWDSHRQPIDFLKRGVILNELALILCTVWLHWFGRDFTPGAHLMLRIYQIGSSLSLFFCALSWLPPESLPTGFLMLMSSRFLNFTTLGFPGLLMGLWLTHGKKEAAQALCTILGLAILVFDRFILQIFFLFSILLIGFHILEEKYSGKNRARLTKITWPIILLATILVMGAGLKFGFYIYRQTNRPGDQWTCWQNDAFYKKVSEGQGLLLLGPDLAMQQLITRRPVLLDPQALDMFTYALEGGPEMAKILKEVYRIDLFSPALKTNGIAVLPQGTYSRLLENRGIEDWKKIRHEFGVTQLLISSGPAVGLPLAASNDRYELYEIPE